MTSTFTSAQIRGHLRKARPELGVGQRGRISAEAREVFDRDVADGLVQQD